MNEPNKPGKIEINLEDLDLDDQEGSEAERTGKLEVGDLSEEPKPEGLVIENSDLPAENKRTITISEARLPASSQPPGRKRPSAKRKRSGLKKALAAALVLLVLSGGAVAALFIGDFFNGHKLAAKDQVSIDFSTAEGITYNSPAGVKIDIEAISHDSTAELYLDAVVFDEPQEDGIIQIYSAYDIEILSETELPEQPEVKLNFSVPDGLDARETFVLFKGQEGYGLPGGTVEVGYDEIKLQVPELSRFIVAMPHNLGDVIPLIREPEDTSLTTEGHVKKVIKLEAVDPLILGFGSSPWFSLEASPGVNQVSVEAPGDWLFDHLTPRRSYLGPREQKDLAFTFYGSGGESSFRLSASSWDAIAITWIDMLHRLATGDPLPWPVGPDLLQESDELAALMSLYEHLQAESQRLEEEQWRGTVAMASAYRLAGYFWEETRTWALAQGEDFLIELIGSLWWRFARTADLFVSQVIYAIAGEAEHNRSFYVRTDDPQLFVEPEEVTIEAGGSIKFEEHLETPDGERLSMPKVDWEVSGGGSIEDGLFQSDAGAEGEYDVKARVAVMGSGGIMETIESSARIVVGKDVITTETEPKPAQEPQEDPSQVKISSGEAHTLVLKEDGSVIAWGLNNKGQLGIDGRAGSMVDRYPEPVHVSNLPNVQVVKAGRYFSLAVTSNGRVWSWGSNYNGQLGDGSTADKHTPVKIDSLTNVKALGAGNSHVLALKNDGTVWSWGHNSTGQLGNGTQKDQSSPVKVSGLNNIKAVSAGSSFSLALTDNGRVMAWGSNVDGQIGIGESSWESIEKPEQVAGLTDVVDISAGGSHALALKANGTVWAWGNNLFGQLGDGTEQFRNEPVRVSGLSDVVAVSAGKYHSYALKKDGTVWAWGSNSNGMLGDGTTTNKTSPVKVVGLDDAIIISAGYYHGHSMSRDGKIFSWGNNGQGRLGDGTERSRNNPVESLF